MMGLGETLFDGESSTKAKAEAPNTSSRIPTAEPSASPPSQTKDYKVILTSILQKGNPGRLGDVDAYLQKYKVSLFGAQKQY